MKTRGIKPSKKVGFVPFFRNNSRYLLALSKHAEFSREQLALSLWSPVLFNFFLSVLSPNSHALLRLDRSPLSTEGILCSHMVAVRYNHRLSCWEVQDGNTSWELIQPKRTEKAWADKRSLLFLMLKDCTSLYRVHKIRHRASAEL